MTLPAPLVDRPGFRELLAAVGRAFRDVARAFARLAEAVRAAFELVGQALRDACAAGRRVQRLDSRRVVALLRIRNRRAERRRRRLRLVR